MNARASFGLAALFVAACGSDESVPFGNSGATSAAGGSTSTGEVCIPGQQIECDCPGSIEGTQVCNANGSGLEPCDCSSYTGGNGAGGANRDGGGAGGENPGGGGSGGVGGSGGAGGMTLCAPGRQDPCYSGPAGTEGMGACIPGTHQCLADGMSYGPCVGETTPQLESCSTPVDDDCDGQTNEDGAGCVCAPNAIAACYDGPPNTENVGPCKGGMHTCDGQGTAWGPCLGQVLPQSDLCMTAIDDDCSGSANDCLGSAPWSKGFGGPGYNNGVGLAIDGAGNPLLLVNCAANTDLGGGALQANYCLGKFTGSGAHVWSKGGFSIYSQGDIATDAGGSYIWSGSFKQPVDFGGGVLLGSNPSFERSFVVKFAANGAHAWSKSFGDTSTGDRARDVATDGVGNVLLIGSYAGTIDFGLGSHTSASGDFYVVKLSPGGVPLWSKSFGSVQGDVFGTIATDAAGSVFLHTRLPAAIDFGGGSLVPNGTGSMAVVKLDAQGNHVWSKACTGSTGGQPMALEIDGAGSVLIAGLYETSFQCGGAPLSAGPSNTYLVKLDASGNYVWGLSPGLPGNSTAIYDIATDQTGNVFLTGSLGGAADFAGTLLVSSGAADVFAAKLSAAGAHLWSQKYGDDNLQYGFKNGLDLVGNQFLTGTFSGTIDFGSGVLVSPQSSGAFLARLP